MTGLQSTLKGWRRTATSITKGHINSQEDVNRAGEHASVTRRQLEESS